MPSFEFYQSCYGGEALSREEFGHYAGEGRRVLEGYQRRYRMIPLEEDADRLAVCRMAEVLQYFEWAENGGQAAGLSVGSMSRSGVPLPDLSRKNRSAELYRAAGLYFEIYRGCQP